VESGADASCLTVQGELPRDERLGKRAEWVTTNLC
jgi:hypothetical protein